MESFFAITVRVLRFYLEIFGFSNFNKLKHLSEIYQNDCLCKAKLISVVLARVLNNVNAIQAKVHGIIKGYMFYNIYADLK